MLNRVDIMGRLTRDPELRYTQNQTAVANFTLAVDRNAKDQPTDFIDCVAWRSTAEFINKYFRKGRMAIVSGHLQIRSYEDQNGRKQRNAEVIVENIYFGDSKKPEEEELPFDL